MYKIILIYFLNNKKIMQRIKQMINLKYIESHGRRKNLYYNLASLQLLLPSILLSSHSHLALSSPTAL